MERTRMRGREREIEREIVYLALLVTVHWQASSSHALDFLKQLHPRSERQYSPPIRCWTSSKSYWIIPGQQLNVIG